jgi:hypothetical protein
MASLDTSDTFAFNDDAELLQLIDRYLDVRSRKMGQAEVCEEADRREEELRAAIRIPKAIFWQKGDAVHSMMRGLPCPTRDGRLWYGPNIEHLRNVPQTLQDFRNCIEVDDERGKSVLIGRKLDPKAQARANEIVAAWDAWQAELLQARITSGEKDATDRYIALSDEEDALLLQIIAMPATTLAGALAKARCAMLECAYRDGFEKQIEAQMADEGGPTSEALCTAIARDLLRMAGESA